MFRSNYWASNYWASNYWGQAGATAPVEVPPPDRDGGFKRRPIVDETEATEWLRRKRANRPDLRPYLNRRESLKLEAAEQVLDQAPEIQAEASQAIIEGLTEGTAVRRLSEAVKQEGIDLAELKTSLAAIYRAEKERQALRRAKQQHAIKVLLLAA